MHQTPAKSLQCRRSPDFCVFQVGASANVKSIRNESMVSLVSRRYMRGENGTESLVVFLSKYVTLQNLEIKYILLEIEKSKNELFFRPCILVNFNG